jgi:YHS domain-containing protein
MDQKGEMSGMSGSRPDTLLDPVCGMTVRLARAVEAGLTIEHMGRTYAFCRSGCRLAFEEEPAGYVAMAEAADAAQVDAPKPGLVVIDEGMRRWYESCSCCLSDAYPEIKAALDAERVAHAAPPVGVGICEVAEAEELATT